MDWETDMAIMFYAPWCTYCKQLLPSWEIIAEETASKTNLIIGKFNCESPAENIEFCRELEIDRYPSVFFVGFGDFHQSPKKNKKVKYPNMVHFRTALYPDAVYDWIRMLSFFSSLHRGWDRIVSIFTGNTQYQKKVQSLQERLLIAERKVRVFGNELEKYKAIEVFDTLEDEGDPFPLLHQLKPDEVR
jgi:thiol-disulfide isomerase/thioredoxin